MLGVGEAYNLMGMGQDHVSDPVLLGVKIETRSLLLLSLLLVVTIDAVAVPTLLHLLLLGWGKV
jgi:hypothetical protein